MEKVERSLLADKLCCGDRDSVIAAGLAVAHGIRQAGVSVLATDAIGRIVVVPMSSIKILSIPRIPDSDLDQMTEEEAINIMLKESREEIEIMNYLSHRDEKGTTNVR